MRLFKLNDMTRGWLIGDFEPSVLKTKEFEVGILSHKKGEVWPEHFHKIATEYNVLISGKMSLNDVILEQGDIFIIDPCENARPVFYEDCKVLCIKTPSLIGDKYTI